MIDILMNDNDIVFSNGDVQLVADDGCILQSAIDNITIKYGEMMRHDNRGNMIYGRRMKLTDISLPQVEQDCISAILYDTRVADAVVKATKNGMFTCDISFTIRTIDSIILHGHTQISLI